MLAYRYMSFPLFLASPHRNIKITFQNKNRHFSYSLEWLKLKIKYKSIIFFILALLLTVMLEIF